MSFSIRSRSLGAAALGALLFAGQPIAAQSLASDTVPRAISLEEALRLAAGLSEAVTIAAAGITSADGRRTAARGQRLPELSSSFSYGRTLINQFGGMGGGTAVEPPTPMAPFCNTFSPDPSQTLAERVLLLERAIGCSTASSGGAFGGIDISRAGFGAANSYNLGLNISQSLFDGGRISAQNRIAEAGVRSAEVEVTAQNAQALVTMAQAYYDALLSARLLEIAEASLAQAQETLRLSELAFEVGDQAEYDVLRARVARNNQRTALAQQRSNRDLAFFALKQLFNLPLDQPITLTTELGEAVVGEVPLPAGVSAIASDTSTNARAPVRQAMEAVRIQEGQVRIARAQERPSLSFSSSYALTAYPQSLVPSTDNWQDNWSVALSVNMPVFNGGRSRGGVGEARGGLDQARGRLQQARENAALDTRTKLESLETARAQWEATAGTVEEAQQAYEIAQLRYQQGMSSLTEVNDARIALSQSQADRAQAARNLYVAQIQLRLIRDLPLSGGAVAAGSAGAQGSPTAGAPAPTGGVASGIQGNRQMGAGVQ